MNKQVSMLAGVGLGAGLMYFLDPDGGRRRRRTAIDKCRALQRDTAWNIRGVAQNASNHVRGAVHETLHLLDRDPVTDEVLVERVRAALGRATSQPRAIEVSVHDGQVVLTGRALASEMPEILREASRVRGVAAVQNELEVDEPQGIPSLQGH
jgi:osmotically-inducible protein OsmY